MEKKSPGVHLGACYYPEHWDERLWEDDYRRMRQAGFTLIRVAEFAWSILEPEEGTFDFALFDRALDAAHRHGLSVILGTPTATPPAWLTEKYPEVLNVTRDGVTIRHGMRRHYNYSSPVYRRLCARITRRMAEHYADHPAVVGWQIDNELNCEISEFYAEADHAAFREWVREKYGTLEALNAAWGTVFWSQTYTAWEQVCLPRPTAVRRQPNPHQALDEKRFISDNAISFAKVQADILREVAPKHWVTTNGLFGHLDSHRLTDELLDFFSYDSYPQFSAIFPDAGDEPLLDRKWSMNLGAVRSISPGFMIMEQQSGSGGWVNRMDMPMPKPGQMRLWTYQSIAHGADAVLYFRWRTATVGHEIYWHGLNDYDNRPNRRVKEAERVGAELSAFSSLLPGTRYEAEVAIVRDYDNEWDGEYDIWHGPFRGKSELAWFKTLQYRHIPCDFLYLREKTNLADLKRYKVLIYPHAAILRDETAAMLEQYVRGGGKLVFGARTGYKNEHGHCYMRPLPGAAAALCGISVEEFTMLGGHRPPNQVQWVGDVERPTLAREFNEVLQTEQDTAEVMAVYASDHFAGKPAVTRNRLGQGKAWYAGFVFDADMAERLLPSLNLRSPADGLVDLPRSVELAIRSDGNKRLLFLLNYKEEAADLFLHREMRDLMSGAVVSGAVALEAYGVMALRISQ